MPHLQNHKLIRHFGIMCMNLLKTDDHQWNRKENHPDTAEKFGSEQNQCNSPGYGSAEYITIRLKHRQRR